MKPNTLCDIPRTYLGLRKLIESLRDFSCWNSQPDREYIELAVAAHYLRLESIEELQKYQSNDYLQEVLGSKTDFWSGLQLWIGSLEYRSALRRLQEFIEHPPSQIDSTLLADNHSTDVETAINAYAGDGPGLSFVSKHKDVKINTLFPEDGRIILDSLIAIHLARLGKDYVLPEFSIGRNPYFSDMEYEKLENEGYFIREGFASDQETDKLRQLVYNLAQREAKEGKAYLYGNNNRLQRVYNVLNKSPIFSQYFLSRAEIFEILHRFFDGGSLHTPYYLSSIQANILNPGANAQALHVDSSVPDPLPPWKIRLNINLLLDPFTESNGATLVYPRSHKFLRKPRQSDAVEAHLKKLTAPAGALVVWTGHLWHQSGANNTQSPRAALLACFVASYLREIAVEENYLEVMDREQLDNLPFEVKSLLGYFHGRKVSA